MAINIPTTKAQKEQNLANYEASLNKTSPLNDKAFLRVQASIDAQMFTQLYKYGVERAKQNLVLTSTGTDLDGIGKSYGVTRKPAESARLTIELPAVTGTIISINIDHVGDPNSERYFPDEAVTAVAGVASIDVTAKTPGVIGNLDVGETLTIGTQVAGAETTSTITAVLNIGAEKEEDAAYKRRILAEIRTVGGGGNAVDYRRWVEGSVAGVSAAYPYSGKPVVAVFEDNDVSFTSSGGVNTVATAAGDFLAAGIEDDDIIDLTGSASNDLTYRVFDVTALSFKVTATLAAESAGALVAIAKTSLPGDRTVFIEADATIEPDGIPPEALLDESRDAINYDPETGIGRPPLGETDGTLFVEPIVRTSMFSEIRNMIISSGNESAAKTGLDTAIDQYFRSITPYIPGIDSETDRNDLITDLTLSTIVQDVLDTYGGSAEGVGFGTSEGLFLSSYEGEQGELFKSGGVSYVNS